MASKAHASQPDPADVDPADDVEGHSMLISPTLSKDLAANRSREIERQVRDQQRARDARAQQKQR